MVVNEKNVFAVKQEEEKNKMLDETQVSIDQIEAISICSFVSLENLKNYATRNGLLVDETSFNLCNSSQKAKQSYFLRQNSGENSKTNSNNEKNDLAVVISKYNTRSSKNKTNNLLPTDNKLDTKSDILKEDLSEKENLISSDNSEEKANELTGFLKRLDSNYLIRSSNSDDSLENENTEIQEDNISMSSNSDKIQINNKDDSIIWHPIVKDEPYNKASSSITRSISLSSSTSGTSYSSSLSSQRFSSVLKPANKLIECGKEHCRLGCICDSLLQNTSNEKITNQQQNTGKQKTSISSSSNSLRNVNTINNKQSVTNESNSGSGGGILRDHCGRFECMFECTCHRRLRSATRTQQQHQRQNNSESTKTSSPNKGSSKKPTNKNRNEKNTNEDLTAIHYTSSRSQSRSSSISSSTSATSNSSSASKSSSKASKTNKNQKLRKSKRLNKPNRHFHNNSNPKLVLNNNKFKDCYYYYLDNSHGKDFSINFESKKSKNKNASIKVNNNNNNNKQLNTSKDDEKVNSKKSPILSKEIISLIKLNSSINYDNPSNKSRKSPNQIVAKEEPKIFKSYEQNVMLKLKSAHSEQDETTIQLQLKVHTSKWLRKSNTKLADRVFSLIGKCLQFLINASNERNITWKELEFDYGQMFNIRLMQMSLLSNESSSMEYNKKSSLIVHVASFKRNKKKSISNNDFEKNKVLEKYFDNKLTDILNGPITSTSICQNKVIAFKFKENQPLRQFKNDLTKLKFNSKESEVSFEMHSNISNKSKNNLYTNVVQLCDSSDIKTKFLPRLLLKSRAKLANNKNNNFNYNNNNPFNCKNYNSKNNLISNSLTRKLADKTHFNLKNVDRIILEKFKALNKFKNTNVERVIFKQKISNMNQNSKTTSFQLVTLNNLSNSKAKENYVNNEISSIMKDLNKCSRPHLLNNKDIVKQEDLFSLCNDELLFNDEIEYFKRQKSGFTFCYTFYDPFKDINLISSIYDTVKSKEILDSVSSTLNDMVNVVAQCNQNNTAGKTIDKKNHDEEINKKLVPLTASKSPNIIVINQTNPKSLENKQELSNSSKFCSDNQRPFKTFIKILTAPVINSETNQTLNVVNSNLAIKTEKSPQEKSQPLVLKSSNHNKPLIIKSSNLTQIPRILIRQLSTNNNNYNDIVKKNSNIEIAKKQQISQSTFVPIRPKLPQSNNLNDLKALTSLNSIKTQNQIKPQFNLNQNNLHKIKRKQDLKSISFDHSDLLVTGSESLKMKCSSNVNKSFDETTLNQINNFKHKTLLLDANKASNKHFNNQCNSLHLKISTSSLFKNKTNKTVQSNKGNDQTLSLTYKKHETENEDEMNTKELKEHWEEELEVRRNQAFKENDYYDIDYDNFEKVNDEEDEYDEENLNKNFEKEINKSIIIDNFFNEDEFDSNATNDIRHHNMLQDLEDNNSFLIAKLEEDIDHSSHQLESYAKSSDKNQSSLYSSQITSCDSVKRLNKRKFRPENENETHPVDNFESIDNCENNKKIRTSADRRKQNLQTSYLNKPKKRNDSLNAILNNYDATNFACEESDEFINDNGIIINENSNIDDDDDSNTFNTFSRSRGYGDGAGDRISISSDCSDSSSSTNNLTNSKSTKPSKRPISNTVHSIKERERRLSLKKAFNKLKNEMYSRETTNIIIKDSKGYESKNQLVVAKSKQKILQEAVTIIGMLEKNEGILEYMLTLESEKNKTLKHRLNNLLRFINNESV